MTEMEQNTSNEKETQPVQNAEGSKKSRLTPLERKWVMYDVGNSIFTLMVSTIFPIFFHTLAKDGGLASDTYLAYWGYAITISTIITALTGPFLGTYADKKDKKKPLFALTIIGGAVLTAFLGTLRQWLVFLIVFVVAKVLYQLSLVIYDSTLSDVTTEDRVDLVSSQGYAWGYIGSCVPFIISLILFVAGGQSVAAMGICCLITGAWWFFISLPLLKTYKQKNYIDEREKPVNLFVQLGHTLKDMFTDKKVFLFVIAFFFYIDGVYTIIDMSTAYASALGLDSTGLLLALLVTQFVAFPSAIIFGRLAAKHRSETLISICIVAYFCIGVFAIFLTTQWQFWVLACSVGVFQGGIQALSRSYFTKIIPAEKSGEYFGLLDICGKGASALGTFMMSFLTQVTGSQQIGVGCIASFFIVGLILFRMSARIKPSRSSSVEAEAE